ncbi:MAG: hypothetical protein HY823_14820 [Acidobacteria bacterium]|nr:hypothetical protein [Acidobacteriota bacterium]
MRIFCPRQGLALLGAFLLAAGLACKSSSSPSGGSTSDEVITVSGKVTYTRVPLLKDANGVPTGLETDPAKFTTKLPARAVQVRGWSAKEETAPDGTKTTVWKITFEQQTGSDGSYSGSLLKGKPGFVELSSRTGTGIRLVSDPSGIDSSLNQAERPLYLYRKGTDGKEPEGTPVPTTSPTANATVDFDLGTTDKWWIGVSSQKLLTTPVRETQGTGSRVLGILDSVYTFSSNYGTVNPGDILDLHYRPGISHPKGSFVEYDRSVYPQAYDSTTNTRHFFGSLRGGSANDDAWDEGVIFPMLARNFLYSAWQWPAGILVSGRLPDLAPDLVLFEGFPDAMAASLLKSPYLADTAGAGATFRDIRDLSGLTPVQRSPYSAPCVAALCWELNLKANSLPSPGTAADWEKINLAALRKIFYYLIVKSTDTTPVVIDTYSLYAQLSLLQADKGANDPVDLKAIFSDAVLTPLLSPFGVPWPRPTTGEYARFLLDWGDNPNSATAPLSPITLSMSGATRLGGTFPGTSHREMAWAKFRLSKDTAYNISLQTVPAQLPAGATILVEIPNLGRTLTFTGTGPATRIPFPGNTDAPVLQFVRVRLVSPDTAIPDVQVTVKLEAAS